MGIMLLIHRVIGFSKALSNRLCLILWSQVQSTSLDLRLSDVFLSDQTGDFLLASPDALVQLDGKAWEVGRWFFAVR